MLAACLPTVPPGVDGAVAFRDVLARVQGEDGPAPGSPEDAEAYLRSEHMLVRFLVARQWNVERTVAMLRDHYQWLAETRMAELLLDPFPEEPHIKSFYPHNYHGVDRRGRPIFIERPGLIDMPRLLQKMTPERLLQYMYAASELQLRRRFPACSVARGEVIDKSVNIIDLTGLGFSLLSHSTATRVLRNIVGVLQSHYPECSGQTIIVNAPKVFSLAWSIVKPMLDEKTLAKISIFGHDKDAYQAALLEVAEADQLPAIFGGSCVCDGQDRSSCMRTVKGPWADPEIVRVLDAHSLDFILTPQGAQELHRQLCESPAAASKHQGRDFSGSSGDAPPAAEAMDEEVFMEAEEVPQELAGEWKEAQLELSLLLEDYRDWETLHTKTLANWTEESNQLVAQIGWRVIERAQVYYDGRWIFEQAEAELTQTWKELDRVDTELEVIGARLTTCELAFGTSNLSAAQWEQLAPLLDEEVALNAGNERLLQSLRLSKLADAVAELQARREKLRALLHLRTQVAKEARRHFVLREEEHSNCSCGCSVLLAAPYYEQRRFHEQSIEVQRKKLRSLEEALQLARRRVSSLLASCGTATPLEAGRTGPSAHAEFELARGGPSIGDADVLEYESCSDDGSGSAR